jgi:hypothetical protein
MLGKVSPRRGIRGVIRSWFRRLRIHHFGGEVLTGQIASQGSFERRSTLLSVEMARSGL